MKKSIHWILPCTAIALTAAIASPAIAANNPKAAKKRPTGREFRVQQLHVDFNEGCDVADYDNDGNLDISAGEFWYPGPRFTKKKPLRKLERFLTDYLTNNGEHAFA